MSKHLEYLIAILSESDHSKLCNASSCDCMSNCVDCPLGDEDDLSSTIKELEVLAHAKA